MKREDAEKMANDIFDMIDSNHPRGLIKSELVDLLCKYDTGHRDIKRDVTETGETAVEQIERLFNLKEPENNFVSITCPNTGYVHVTYGPDEEQMEHLKWAGYVVTHYGTNEPYEANKKERQDVTETEQAAIQIYGGYAGDPNISDEEKLASLTTEQFEFTGTTDEEVEHQKKILKSLGYYFTEDPCGND